MPDTAFRGGVRWSDFQPKCGALHEHPRIPGQGGAARVRRADAARAFRRSPSTRRCKAAKRAWRPGLGGEGADPRRRPRQGRRRQGGQIDRRREEGSDAHPRLDPGHAPDRPEGQAGQPPLHRGRLRDRQGVLPVDAGRPRHLARRVRGLDRRRHGHREGRARHAGEDRHHLGRSGRPASARITCAASPRRSASTPICRSR